LELLRGPCGVEGVEKSLGRNVFHKCKLTSHPLRASLMKPLDYNPPTDPLTILHRDEDLIVVSKPSGLLSVPGKDPSHQDCLEMRVKSLFNNALLVHRLDMDTSGVMLFAGNPNAQRHLGLQFEKRQLEKSYEALVWGEPEDEGVVELPLIVDWPNRPLQKVCYETGKAALTHWQLIEKYRFSSRVRLIPKTGRSHQLRVHMKAIGHPILGDRFYADGDALVASQRLSLHSRSIRFRHPTGGEWVEFEDPTPF